ncbi:MAG TPA: hypothetical protein VL913_00095 [Candidatus Micrarchaeaceae archaeon]|nr:hypothetical protein [Candidatus Micrarchaeaceae archaeon]
MSFAYHSPARLSAAVSGIGGERFERGGVARFFLGDEDFLFIVENSVAAGRSFRHSYIN